MFEIYYEIRGSNRLSSVIIDAKDNYEAICKFYYEFYKRFPNHVSYRVEKMVNLNLVVKS